MNKRLIKSNDEGGVVPPSFNTVLYTGNGTSQSITGVGFQPDFTWIKQRNGTASHSLQDSVRGAGQNFNLYSDNTAYEGQYGIYGYLSSFDINGFTVNAASGSHTNASGTDYVAWNFKAGGAAVANTDGTITSQVSANTEAGFSVVSYTGNGIAAPIGASIGHGLSSQPKIIIVKDRTNTGTNWCVLPVAASDSTAQILLLNDTAALTPSGDANAFNQQLPTDNVFYVGQTGGGSRTNGLNSNYIAYCFAEVAGFSKFGSYVGNGTSTAPFVDCGFEPAFLLFKKSSGTIPTGWVLIDNKRDNTNPNSLYLFPNNSNSEGDYPIANFYSNGFEVLGPDQTTNASGQTYIYMAFANQF